MSVCRPSRCLLIEYLTVCSLGDDITTQSRRIHVYDVYDNKLKEVHHIPEGQPSVFEDLDIGSLDVDTRHLIHKLEETFFRLQSVVRSALKDIMDQISDHATRDDSYKIPLSVSCISVEDIRKYFIFLRFRNSKGYQDVIQSLHDAYQDHDKHGNVAILFRPLIAQNQLRFILREFIRFLSHRSGIGLTGNLQDRLNPVTVSMDSFLALMDSHCWSLCHAEIFFGQAQDDQEYIFSERCFGTLDDEVEDESSVINQ